MICEVKTRSLNATSRRISRLLSLVSILQSGRAMDSRALAEMCGVSRRTIFRDLRSLREAEMQIVFNEQNQTYVLNGLDFRNIGLSREELRVVCLVCQILPREHPGLSHEICTVASAAATKLSLLLTQEGRDRLHRLSRATVIEQVAQENTEFNHAAWKVIQLAVERNRRVRIRYGDHQVEKEFSTLLSPYHIVWHIKGCRVIGRSSRHRGVQLFDLCDIHDAELTEADFTIPSRFSLERFSSRTL